MAKGKASAKGSAGAGDRQVYREFGPADPMARAVPDRPPNQQTVRVQVSRKGRGGKTVTVITGLPGTDDDLRSLASDLKRRCGTGGTLKDGVIEIQGDHRDTLVEALKSKGIRAKKAGG